MKNRVSIPTSTVLLTFLCGCHGYLVPYDDTPLPARSAPARGGAELEVKEGEIFLRPGVDDPGAWLGVGLKEAEAGVAVTHRLRPDAPLQTGDRLLRLSAVWPSGSPGHAVTCLADLAGLGAGAGWLELELLVHRGSEEVPVRIAIRDEPRWLPARRWDPRSTFQRNGLELCSLADWSPEDLPAWARPEDYMVVRVDVDSQVGLAGLRPLDIVTNAEQFERSGRATIRQRDGALKEILVPAQPMRHDMWIPFLISREMDGIRTHLGFGPLDVLFHRSESREYDAVTDSYNISSRGSVLSIFSYNREGAKSSWAIYTPFLDMARLEYAVDLPTITPFSRSRPDLSRAWGQPTLEEFLGAK